MGNEIKHDVQIPESQRNAADRLTAELNASDAAAAETKAQEVEEGAEAQDDTTVTDAGKSQEEIVEPAADETDTTADEKAAAGKDSKDSETKAEKPESELTPEEKKIRDLERLVDAPADSVNNDKLSPEERIEWKSARLKERQRVRQLEIENAKLRAQQTTGIPEFTHEMAEKAVAKLDEEWLNGQSEDITWEALEARKNALRTMAEMSAITQAQRHADEQARRNAEIDNVITKLEPSLPGLKKAFLSMVKDPELGRSPLLGNVIFSNLHRGGIQLCYYLEHHRSLAHEILALPVDEAAARFFDLRTKLLRGTPKAQPSSYRPDKPIIGSNPVEIGEASRRDQGNDDVQAEARKYRQKVKNNTWYR